MKHIDVKSHILILIKKLLGKILNLKWAIMLGYQNMNTFSNCSEEHLVIKKVKNTVP